VKSAQVFFVQLLPKIVYVVELIFFAAASPTSCPASWHHLLYYYCLPYFFWLRSSSMPLQTLVEKKSDVCKTD